MDENKQDELVAYLDGELDDEATRRVETTINVDPTVRAEVDSLRRVWELLDYLPPVEAPETFTHQTMRQLGPAGQTTVLAPRAKRFSWLILATWTTALALAFATAYLGMARQLAQPTQEDMVRELSVIENLAVYRAVGTLEYAEQLNHPDLFGQEITFGRKSPPASVPRLPEDDAGEPVLLAHNLDQLQKVQEDGDHVERLNRDLRAFWKLSHDERQQLRQLDQALRRAKNRSRLLRVMERYQRWLQRLSAGDRQSIVEAESPRQRIRLVKEMREQEWVATLPRAVREELSKLSSTERRKMLAKRREFERFERWFWMRPKTLKAFPREVREYVQASLLPLLTNEERARFNRSDGSEFPDLACLICDLSKKHPIPMPGLILPVYADHFPESLKKALKRPAHKRLLARIKQENLEGKWPEIGVFLNNAPAARGRSLLPPKYKPSTIEAFSKDVQVFYRDELLPVLTAEQESHLKNAEGKWPLYPQTLQRVALEHGLRIPGTYLPGPPEGWEQFSNP